MSIAHTMADTNQLNQTGVDGRGATLALAGICLGFFLVLFDATAVNVATGGVGDGLHASDASVQWVLNAYTVALAAGMLTAGGLGDRWGSRRVYLGGTLLFAVASAACAFAPNAPALITLRAVQGVGAAAVVPCSLALISHRFPAGRQRARALGVWGGISGIGLAAGPLLGGLLVTTFGWRSVFLVVVPFAVVSVRLVASRVDETPTRATDGWDMPGQVLVTAALVALTAAFTETAQRGWDDGVTMSLFALAVAAGAGFVAVEARGAAPMLPPRLFRNKRFSGAVLVGLLFNFGLYGVLFCVTTVLERALRETALFAGLALLPLTAVTAGGALVSGRLVARVGPRTPMLVGLGGGLLATALFAWFGDRSGVVALAGTGAVLGLVGLAMPAMTAVALDAAGAQHSGLGAAVLNTARQAGGALGVAVLGSTLFAATDRGGAVLLLREPMVVAAIAYLLAVVATIPATAAAARTGVRPDASVPSR